jgi:TetR/AcrR family transcriptional regulator, transcriptional repressor of aconitase
MRPIRLSGEARRETILAAAKCCFARHGFAGTTTKSVAAAAGISEGLLFKHFPTKSALYSEILAEVCEANEELSRLQALEPSTATLVFLVSEMIGHFLRAIERPDDEDVQRIKLLMSSHLEDGEFARLLYQKVGVIIGPIFTASLARAVKEGDATPSASAPMNLFWFAHQMIQMITLTQLPKVASLSYADPESLKRQVCEFVLRGLGLKEHALTTYLDNASETRKNATQLIPENV